MRTLLRGFVLTGILTAACGLAFGAAVIQVNDVCETSNCTVGTLSAGGSDSGSFDFNSSINGDLYNFTGNYSATLSKSYQSHLDFNLLVTYKGLAATTAVDDITITDLLDKFSYPYTYGYFNEAINVSFPGPAGTLADTSNAEGYLTVDGNKLPILGPFNPPDSATSHYANAYFTGLGNPLLEDDTLIAEFGSGSKPGAQIDFGLTTIPEPGCAIPALAGLFALASWRRLRRTSETEA
jgi:hypothetical protein